MSRPLADLEPARDAIGRGAPAAGGRRVLVTGGAGFIGCNLVDRLAARGHEVVVLDSLARPNVGRNLAWLAERHGRRVEPVRADVRDAATLGRIVRDVDAVVHLAAQVAVTSSLADPVLDFEVNARGTLNVLEAVRACPNPPGMIFASTNKVYGTLLPDAAFAATERGYWPQDERYAGGCDERAPLALHSPYGCSKGAADQYVLDYARVFGLRTVVFRMSCIYGPRQFGTEDQGWAAHFLLATLRGEPITIYGDGHQVRDILFVDDAVGAYVMALERIDELAGSAFNLGGGEVNALSLLGMLERIRALTMVEPEIIFGPRRPGDQLWYVSDTDAFSTATGWRPQVDVTEGMKLLESWARTLQPGSPSAPRQRAMACG